MHLPIQQAFENASTATIEAEDVCLVGAARGGNDRNDDAHDPGGLQAQSLEQLPHMFGN
jgi:hypothetical protein